MRKIISIVAALLLLVSHANAQFESGGTGKYQRQIYWLPWYWSTDNGATGLISIEKTDKTIYKYNGKTAVSIMNGTYTWMLSPKLRIVGTISNITGSITTRAFNSYGTSGLQRMYTGVHTTQNALAALNGESKLDLKLVFQLSNDGVNWTNIDPNEHGMVFADAESVDNAEYISGLVNNSSNWYLIDRPETNVNGKGFGSSKYKICMSEETVDNVSYTKSES